MTEWENKWENEWSIKDKKRNMIKTIQEIINDLEALLSEKDYLTFEKKVFDNIHELIKVNRLLIEIRGRLKDKLPREVLEP